MYNIDTWLRNSELEMWQRSDICFLLSAIWLLYQVYCISGTILRIYIAEILSSNSMRWFQRECIKGYPQSAQFNNTITSADFLNTITSPTRVTASTFSTNYSLINCSKKNSFNLGSIYLKVIILWAGIKVSQYNISLCHYCVHADWRRRRLFWQRADAKKACPSDRRGKPLQETPDIRSVIGSSFWDPTSEKEECKFFIF